MFIYAHTCYCSIYSSLSTCPTLIYRSVYLCLSLSSRQHTTHAHTKHRSAGGNTRLRPSRRSTVIHNISCHFKEPIMCVNVVFWLVVKQFAVDYGVTGLAYTQTNTHSFSLYPLSLSFSSPSLSVSRRFRIATLRIPSAQTNFTIYSPNSLHINK